MSWFRRLTLAAAVLCFGVVVLGAYVRLSDAGLGCPDWPGCYGHLTVPADRDELAAAAENYPQRPVEAHKAWKEMIHRYFASTLGLLIVGLAFASTRLRDEGAPRRLPWLLVGLVIFQGLLGMWTVTWQLKPLAVSAHLIGGMLTLALLAWMWLAVRRPAVMAAPQRRPARSERHVMLGMLDEERRTLAPAPLRWFAATMLALVALQIFLGGWTSSNYAALACPDFPTCHGSYWPDMDGREAFTLWRGLGINYEGGVLDNRARVTIHFAHRLGALCVGLAGFALAGILLRRKASVDRHLGAALAAALAIQIALGIAIVMLQLPLLLADMHNAGAAVLLLTLVALNHSLWTVPRDR